MWYPFKKKAKQMGGGNFSQSFKLDLAGGMSIYMYIYPDRHVEFVWAPMPPYTPERLKEINARFLPWAKKCMGQ